MSALPKARFLDRTTPPHIMTLVLLAAVGAMNLAVFLPALTQMAAFFEAPYASVALAVPLYLMAVAVLQLFIGPISDRYGRRPVILWSLAIFTFATLCTVFTQSVEAFLFWRVVQAVIAASFVLSRAIVRDMVPAEQAASMIGYVAMGMALVPMVAPMIGGALSEALGWQATFIFTMLAGIAVFAIAWQDLSETADLKDATFRGQFAQYPELFASRRFWGYALAAAFASGAFFAFLGGAPFVSTNSYGLSETMAGVGFGAPAIGYATGNFIAGRFSTALGFNRMILLGAVTTSLGMAALALLAITGMDTATLFFALCATIGLGNGMTIPNATAGMMSVRPQLAGTASGIGGAIMIGGGAALSALASALLERFGGVTPLAMVMLISSVLGLLSILYVMQREKVIART